MDHPEVDDAQDPTSPRPSLSPSPRLPLPVSQLALARSRAYALFAGLYLEGLTDETLAYVEAIPELVGAMPGPFDADGAAADHQQLFGFDIFPYQCIFLDPSGLLGGDVAEEVLGSYKEAGFSVQGRDGLAGENADHIGQELRFLAFLCGEEAEAWESGLPPMARRTAALQREFLDRHLLRWLPPLVVAIRQQENPFYTILAQLTLELAADHRAGLEPSPAAGFQLPEPPKLLEDEQTGLKEIVTYLLTPVYSGIYLGRDDIGRLARQRALPRGFGGRQQMLLNLLRSAANYDGVDTVLDALQEVIAGWATAYGEMAAEPALKSSAKLWRSRANETAGMLEKMSRRLQSGD